ncbi:MAG: SAM-dependent chlorinase/fluorinase [Gammaproteobacteria bacterium]|nr:SAM-dependent chlorinase/fluorinase [Gammaproteobacteria bacterium]
MARPIYLLTDFGWTGPYVGQLHAAILAVSDASRVIDVMHDLPAMRPDLAAYLLPGVCRQLAVPGVVVAVVDPGVGGDRDPLIVETTLHTYVGPDNGLLCQLDDITAVYRIDWRPPRLSPSFHGRDLFAPVAARLAVGSWPASMSAPVEMAVGADWPDVLKCVVYIDAYGNAVTGVPAKGVDLKTKISISGRSLGYASTFCQIAHGELFWYRNSQGLVEIAAREASAAKILSLALGDRILLH